MRIGLLTFHDTNNFGSYLQTYGLYRKIVDLGYECEIINYHCKSIYEREVPASFRLSLKPKQILKELLFNRHLRRKYRQLKGWLYNNALISERYDMTTIERTCQKYDKFIVGSDIVWGMDIIEKDTTFFLDFLGDNNKKFAFSSSIGTPWSEDEKIILKPLLLNFSDIAVREDESADWVEEIIKKRPCVVCDPTMLLTTEEWSKFKSEKYSDKKYVLVYFPTPENMRVARQYADNNNLDCYIIRQGLPIKGFTSVNPMNIADYLSLFFYASFVFTASYHGMLYSIYFNRQFAYYNRAHKSRMETLARKLHLTQRDGVLYDVTKMDKIRYEEVNAYVNEYRKHSIETLESMLRK